MITEKDLQEAIAECQGKRNADSSTCIKLAAFYTIKDHLFPEPSTNAAMAAENVLKGYSYADEPGATVLIGNYGETEFARAIDGRSPEEIWPVIVELMDVLSAINPRLYTGVMSKIEA